MVTAVTEALVARAREIVIAEARRLEEVEFLELMDALGWFDLVSYNEEGRVVCDLSDLQQVALACVLRALRRGTK